jgi:hypothetical protein
LSSALGVTRRPFGVSLDLLGDSSIVIILVYPACAWDSPSLAPAYGSAAT